MTRIDSWSTIPFAVGVAVAGLTQAAIGWWLNSGRGVAIVVAALFAVAAIGARATRGAPWTGAAWFWGGTMAAMTAALFWTGPGTIWPIVLAVAALLTAAAIAAGTFVGRRRNRPPSRGPTLTRR